MADEPRNADQIIEHIRNLKAGMLGIDEQLQRLLVGLQELEASLTLGPRPRSWWTPPTWAG